jgi:hypothetical protein
MIPNPASPREGMALNPFVGVERVYGAGSTEPATREWLGRQDSNLGMAESKSVALPLGYAP